MSDKRLAFLSYRRDDSRDWANLIADTLRFELGPTSAFLDTDAIRIGDDWTAQIETALHAATVVIPIIGPKWLFVQNESNGRRRLDTSDDWVRREIEYALSSNLPIIPVFVSGARIPTAADLPESIAVLPRTQGTVVSEKADVQKVSKILVEKHGFRRRGTLTEMTHPPAVDLGPPLNEADLTEAIRTLNRFGDVWHREERASEYGADGIAVELLRKYMFANFEDAVHFINTASRYITSTAHHPFWQNQYQEIRVRLSTFDVKLRITAKDIRLAEYLDRLYRDYVPQELTQAPRGDAG